MKRGSILTSASGRGPTSLERALAVLAMLTVVAGMLIVGAANPPSVLGAPGSNTTTFSVVVSGSVTAGTPFTVTVSAKDSRGRTVSSYPGGASLSGLAAAPDTTPASYGTLTSWVNGVASTSVTATRSQTGAHLTATDTIDGVPVSGQSSAFSVAPASAAEIAFADTANGFNGQPVDTQSGTPITSSLSTGAPVKVLALDTFGNRVGGVGVTMSAPSQLGGTKTATTNNSASFGTSPYGEASFANLLITPFGNYRLVASAGTLTSPQSDQFEIVADLEKCTGSSCRSTGRSAGANLQITYSSVTGSGLSGVVLTTSFIGPATSAGCDGADAAFGELTEARVQGSAVTTAQPDFQMAVIVPKTTLQVLGLTSRAVDTYNLCVGAKRLDGGTGGWTGRQTIDGPIVTLTNPVQGVYWGWAAVCGTPGLDAVSPCISLKTKNAGQLQAELGLSKNEIKALPFESSDLALVLEKHYPWDAKSGMR